MLLDVVCMHLSRLAKRINQQTVRMQITVSAPMLAPSLLICVVCLLQGQKQVPNGRDTSWPLAPAQEHKYDALAAFDAGQLQEAQHAFDLSVWSDLKGDKGG